MAWSTPRTWVTGELVTSSIMNQHVRDNLLGLRAVGVSSVSWPGGQTFSSNLTVTHGLGVTPTTIVATPTHDIGINLNQVPVASWGSPTSTTFILRGHTIDGQLPAAGTVWSIGWHAIP